MQYCITPFKNYMMNQFLFGPKCDVCIRNIPRNRNVEVMKKMFAKVINVAKILVHAANVKRTIMYWTKS